MAEYIVVLDWRYVCASLTYNCQLVQQVSTLHCGAGGNVQEQQLPADILHWSLCGRPPCPARPTQVPGKVSRTQALLKQFCIIPLLAAMCLCSMGFFFLLVSMTVSLTVDLTAIGSLPLPPNVEWAFWALM